MSTNGAPGGGNQAPAIIALAIDSADGDKSLFGDSDDVSVRFENGELIFEDETGGNSIKLVGLDHILENTEFYKGEDSSGNEIQLIGVTAGDRVLVGDVTGQGLVTDIEADGTVGISIQTNGNVNFDNGNVRINADGNKAEFGAGQDASVQYDGTDMIINPKEVGSGILGISGHTDQGSDTSNSRRIQV